MKKHFKKELVLTKEDNEHFENSIVTMIMLIMMLQ